MAGKADFLENELLDHVFGKGSYSSPAPVWIGLWTASLADDSDGSTAGEVSGGGYSRQSAPATKWGSASGGSISNTGSITFPSATASWGTVTHFGIFDASSAGNLLYFAALSASKKIESGDTPKFAAGALTVSED